MSEVARHPHLRQFDGDLHAVRCLEDSLVRVELERRRAGLTESGFAIAGYSTEAVRLTLTTLPINRTTWP